MAILHKTDQAERDVTEILKFLESLSVRAADRFAAEYDRVCNLLAAQPGMGRSRRDLRPGLRSVVVLKYVVIYSLILGGVSIIRVVHGSRDLRTVLDAD